jgi:atypical dual specificity phosphatase
MPAPYGFYWVEKPKLAGLAYPGSLEDLDWLRGQRLDVLISLAEDPLRRDWVRDSGLLVFHVPMEDMEAPSQEQLDRCISAIAKAHGKELGVAVHCTAGKGRTGAVLAAYLVYQGTAPREAMSKIRRLRPGSIETVEQEEAIIEFGKRQQP